jgi:acyl-CoA thioesterase-2
VHSLHASFIRCDPGVPIVYTVDRIRDCRSFTTRRAVEVQHGRAIFALSALFQAPAAGPEYRKAPMPEAPDPETVLDWQERLRSTAPASRSAGCAPDRSRSDVGDSAWAAKADGGHGRPAPCLAARPGNAPRRAAAACVRCDHASVMTLLDAVLRGHGLASDERSVTGPA